MLENLSFLNPYFFWLFSLIPLLIMWEIYSHKNIQAHLQLSNIDIIKRKTLRIYLRPTLFIFRIITLSLLIIAIARPQTSETSVKSKTNKGIDIVMFYTN